MQNALAWLVWALTIKSSQLVTHTALPRVAPHTCTHRVAHASLSAKGTVEQVLNYDFGKPLHILIICGEMHELEQEMFDFYRIGKN